MIGVSAHGRNGEKYYYYECKGVKNGSCRKKRAVREEIESLVIDEAKKIYGDDELKGIFVRTFRRVFTKIMRGTVSKVESMKTELERLEKKKDSYLDSVAENPSLGKMLADRLLALQGRIEELKNSIALHGERLKTIEITEKDVQDYLDSIFLSSSSEEAVKSAIIDCMINRVEVEDGGKVGVMFNVIRNTLIDEIEKNPDDLSISPILRESGSFKVTMVDREGLEPATR